jgi:uncharacterized protein (TIGR03435 family)
MKARTGLSVVAVLALVGALNAPGLRAQAPSPTADPRFEVASVKASPPGTAGEVQWGRNTWSTAGPMAFRMLLGFAFNTGHFSGLPDWSRTAFYTINAKAEDGVLLTREELSPRLRQLLAERFKLAAHMETTYVDGYALVIAKGGPTLKATTAPAMMNSLGGDGKIRAPSATMEYFANGLAQIVQQPVVNETGLAGNFDFTLTYVPEGPLDSTLSRLFTALQEQLGLKLESRHRLPAETLVIDHVERPTAD